MNDQSGNPPTPAQLESAIKDADRMAEIIQTIPDPEDQEFLKKKLSELTGEFLMQCLIISDLQEQIKKGPSLN